MQAYILLLLPAGMHRGERCRSKETLCRGQNDIAQPHPAWGNVHSCRSLCRMHNGVVGGFMHIRRALLARLSDAAYDTIQSFHSDSAICFAIFLHHLPDLTSQHQPSVLLKALEVRLAHPRHSTATSIASNHLLCADKPALSPSPPRSPLSCTSCILSMAWAWCGATRFLLLLGYKLGARSLVNMCDVDFISLQATLALIADTQRAAGITETSLLNFVVTDGHTMIATRCVFPETEAAASLYYAEGSAFQRSPRPEQSPLPPRAKPEMKASLDSRASARDTSVTGKLSSAV